MRTVSSKNTSTWMGMEILFLLLIAIFNPPPPGLAQGVPGAPVITQQPHDVVAPEGGSARFSVEATGESLTYHWFYRAEGAPDFQPLPDQTQSSLLLTNLRGSQAGFYQAVVSNPHGSTPTAPALLVVIPLPTKVKLFCKDGKPITNGCDVTITLTNASGYSEPKAANAPLGNPADPWYWTKFGCPGGLDASETWWFMVTASCCTNVWILPTTKCYGDFEPLICNSCGDCPTPKINCPTSIELLSPCGQCVTHNYSNPSVINGNLVACNPPPGSCFPVGATIVTCTATNQCGDVASCEFPIIVRSCLKCPPSRIYECGTHWDFDQPTVEPGCAAIEMGVLNTVTNGICPQTITRTWSVVMTCGGGLDLVTQCSQTVTVVDTTPPIIACAADKSVACGSDWSFDPPSVADDGCSPIQVKVLTTVTNSPCTTQTAIVRTWIATDACGNSTTCSQTVYIDQTGPPIVSCPQDKDVDCGTDWSFDQPVIISSCSSASIRVLNTETNGSCPIRITRTWMIDNQCGHVVECSQTVTVLGASSQTVFTLFSGRDSSGLLPLGAQDPQFTFGCLPPNMGPTTPVVTTPHPLWIPNGPQSQWIGPSLSNFGLGGTYCYQVEFNLPTCPSGQPKYSLTGRWAGDDSGAIHLNGSSTGNFLPVGWAFTNWHPISITSGLVPGPNLLTFYVTNGSAGPTGLRVELAVTALCCGCTNPCVVDIRCPSNITNTICGTSGVVNYLAPTASSSCGPITSLVCVPPSGSSFPLGTTTVTCTATDAQGHSASCSFDVTMIRHQTPWTLTCPPVQLNVTGCPPVLPNLFALATVTTNCPIPGGLTWTNYGPGNVVLTNGSPLPPGQTVVILRVCDGAGNCRD
ncbi:MAG: HYR domain-containing protein, partial [Verrucomicrobia bacterium]|nr:HYR domain-containing protein [Verrucomicrobiota bacterium]